MPGIYIHVPFCKSKCSYFDFASYPREIGKAEAYFACLYREMKGRSENLKSITFDTVYFGGGTPSYVDPKFIYGAMKQISNLFSVKPTAEVTLEVNPGTIDAEKLEVYKKAGINRFSIGLQSANDKTLLNINRIHNVEDFNNAVNLLKDYNLSVDVMIGLPNETIDDVKNTIELATSKQGVNHISLYALKAEDGTPMYTRYLNGELPSDDEVADIYDFSVKLLKEKGYNRYEVSNFCKDGYYSRHNKNYWKRGEYIGFGVGASSFINGRRFTNTESIDEYVHCILNNRVAEIFSENVEGNDAKSEYVMLALRTSEGINLQEYKNVFGTSFKTDFKDAIIKNKQYLEIKGLNVKIKDEYLYVQNTILVDFIG